MPVSPHLSAFAPSVSQVLDWVEQHGEVFLNKHSGVGKSLHRARALQKRHDDFQQVAQVSHFDLDLTEPDWVACVDHGFPFVTFFYAARSSQLVIKLRKRKSKKAGSM